MTLTNNKAFRRSKKRGTYFGLLHFWHTFKAASMRPHNISQKISPHKVCDIISDMFFNFRRYRKLIRHGGYRPADIADMIIQKGGAL